MMISGKSALRKKRFKKASRKGYLTSFFTPRFGVRDERTDLGLADPQSLTSRTPGSGGSLREMGLLEREMIEIVPEYTDVELEDGRDR